MKDILFCLTCHSLFKSCYEIWLFWNFFHSNFTSAKNKQHSSLFLLLLSYFDHCFILSFVVKVSDLNFVFFSTFFNVYNDANAIDRWLNTSYLRNRIEFRNIVSEIKKIYNRRGQKWNENKSKKGRKERKKERKSQQMGTSDCWLKQLNFYSFPKVGDVFQKFCFLIIKSKELCLKNIPNFMNFKIS